jgi:hypothetical protein
MVSGCYNSTHARTRLAGSSQRPDSPLKRQFRLVFAASTTLPRHLIDAHGCPVQHHVRDDAEAVRVDLNAKENDLVIDSAPHSVIAVKNI